MTYKFVWSENDAILVHFHSNCVANPFSNATDLMTAEWIYDQLLNAPETFTHPKLECVTLTVAVTTLRPLESSPRARTQTSTHSDSTANTVVGDDYVPIDIPPWKYWKEDNIVASTMQNFSMTSGPPSGPKNYVFVDEHNRHKRLKVMRACESCRRRKIKCDSATTNTWPCAACVRLKLHCVPPAGGLEGEPGDTGVDSAVEQSIESQPFVQNPPASLQQAPSYGLATPPFPATQARNFSYDAYVANYSKPPYDITENGYYPNPQQYPGALDDQDQAGAQVFPQYQGDPDSQREERAVFGVWPEVDLFNFSHSS
jgi:hypothetical protein